MKRILIVSQYFWPEEFSINNVALELASRGFSVDILTGLPNYPDGKLFSKFKKNRENFNKFENINIYRVPIWLRGNSKFSLFLNYVSFPISASLYGIFLLRKKSYDSIIAVQLSPIFSVIPAIILKKIKKTNLIYWVLDIWPDSLFASGDFKKGKLVFKILYMLCGFIYRAADKILVSSNAFINELQKHDINRAEFIFFPQWVQPFKKLNSARNLKLETILKENKEYFNILFSGNIGKSQDFESIIEAAKFLKKYQNIRFLIVGSGRMDSYLKEEIMKNDLNQIIKFYGRYPYEDMDIFYKNASAMLISLKDHSLFNLTLPRKMQDYLQTSKPILSMANGEIKNTIIESNAGLTADAGDYKKLVENVLKLASLQEHELKLFGTNGVNYSQKNYNKDIIIKKLIGIL